MDHAKLYGPVCFRIMGNDSDRECDLRPPTKSKYLHLHSSFTAIHGWEIGCSRQQSPVAKAGGEFLWYGFFIRLLDIEILRPCFLIPVLDASALRPHTSVQCLVQRFYGLVSSAECSIPAVYGLVCYPNAQSCGLTAFNTLNAARAGQQAEAEG
jgi:hypothetical protein